MSVQVVRAPAQLDAASGDAFERDIINALEHTPEVLTLDLGDVQFCDSYGLRVFMRTHKRCRGLRTQLQVRNTPDSVLMIAKMTGITAVIDFAGP